MSQPKTLPEPLSVSLAVALGVAYTALYVLPFYASPTTRPSPTLSRSDPAVIKARVRLVTLTCLVCTPVTVFVLQNYMNLSLLETARILGIWPIALVPTFNVVLLTAVLFAGPLFERGYVESGWRRWIQVWPLRESLKTWTGWRNYVAGPISEEYLFRALLLPIYVLSGIPRHAVLDTSSSLSGFVPTAPILLSPLPFALAHLHHIHETRMMHPHHALLPIVLGGVFQFAYTALFGWFAAFAFVRTGSLLGVVLCHSFCNWMGLPRVWGWVEPEDPQAFAPTAAQSDPWDAGPAPQDVVAALGADSDEELDGLRARGAKPRDKAARVLGLDQPSLAQIKAQKAKTLIKVYTAVYYLLLVAGAVGFRILLWPLTAAGTYAIRV